MKFLLILPLFSFLSLAAPPPSNNYGMDFCSLCTEVIQSLLGQVFHNEKELEHYLNNYCDQNFGSGTWEDAVCRSAFSAAVPWIIKQLQNNPNVQPAQLCQDVDLCSNAVPPKKVQPLQQQQPGRFCEVCKAEINALTNVLKGEALEDKIKGYFIHACIAVIPSSNDRQVCENVVDQYFPQIWDKILAYLDGQALCADIGLCHSSNTPFHKNQVGSITSLGCSFCQTVFGWFQKQIMTPQTETALLKDIETVCGYIPNVQYQQTCHKVIQNYGTELFQSVANMLNPDHVCQILTACPTK